MHEMVPVFNNKMLALRKNQTSDCLAYARSRQKDIERKEWRAYQAKAILKEKWTYGRW